MIFKSQLEKNIKKVIYNSNFNYNLRYLIYNLVKKVYMYTPKEFQEHLKRKKFYSRFIKKNDLCFDIGANRGKYTKIFLDLGAKIICVEPQKSCIDLLKFYFSNNKNVIIIQKALGNKQGFGEINICPIDSLSSLSEKFITISRYSSKFNNLNKKRVEITTLDNLIKIYGKPQFCKIDVEGYEFEVLSGLTQKIQFICFEFHKELFDETLKCIDHLNSLGKVKFNVSFEKELKFFFQKWISSKKLQKELSENKNPNLVGDIYVKFS